MSRTKLFLFAAVALGLALPERRVEAQASCTITTLTNVAYGTYNVFSAVPLDSTGRIRIRCNAAANPVTVDLGRGSAPTFNPRYMVNGTEHLNYNLYLDAARLSIWGDNTGGTSHYGPVNPPNNRNVNLTIYARVPAGQDVAAGAYNDVVITTINF